MCKAISCSTGWSATWRCMSCTTTSRGWSSMAPITTSTARTSTSTSWTSSPRFLSTANVELGWEEKRRRGGGRRKNNNNNNFMWFPINWSLIMSHAYEISTHCLKENLGCALSLLKEIYTASYAWHLGLFQIQMVYHTIPTKRYNLILYHLYPKHDFSVFAYFEMHDIHFSYYTEPVAAWIRKFIHFNKSGLFISV